MCQARYGIPEACNGKGKLVLRCSFKACSRLLRCCSSCCFNILRFSWREAVLLTHGQTEEGRCTMCLKVRLLCELPPPAAHNCFTHGCLPHAYKAMHTDDAIGRKELWKAVNTRPRWTKPCMPEPLHTSNQTRQSPHMPDLNCLCCAQCRKASTCLTECKQCLSSSHPIGDSACLRSVAWKIQARMQQGEMSCLPGMTRTPLGPQPTRQDCPSIRPASATQPEALVKLIGLAAC